eukprot:6484155-Amphidinium_carterae.1
MGRCLQRMHAASAFNLTSLGGCRAALSSPGSSACMVMSRGSTHTHTLSVADAAIMLAERHTTNVQAEAAADAPLSTFEGTEANQVQAGPVVLTHGSVWR